MTESERLQFSYVASSGAVAGRLAVAAWYAGVGLAGLYLVALVAVMFDAGTWGLFNAISQALSPFMLAALMPSIGLVAGPVLNWAADDNRKDDTRTLICIALGQAGGALLALTALGLDATPLAG